MLSDGEHSYAFVKGAGAIEAGTGAAGEEWTFAFPSWMRPHFYSAFAIFYDGSEAAWQKKLPPDDHTFVLKQFDLGGRERRAGDAVP